MFDDKVIVYMLLEVKIIRSCEYYSFSDKKVYKLSDFLIDRAIKY